MELSSDTSAVLHFCNFTKYLPPRLLPLFVAPVSAGFPSPADDYVDKKLDLNELIRNPAATFLVRVEGTSMIDAGIHPGDILIADRSLQPHNDQIIIAKVENEFLVKRLHRNRGKLYLLAENALFKPLEINPQMDFEVWAVVTCVIHQFEKLL